MLFVVLVATLCEAKTSVDFEAAEVKLDELAEIIHLPHGVPAMTASTASLSARSVSFWPPTLAEAFVAFARAMRHGVWLCPDRGVVAIDGKRVRRGY